MPVVSVLNTGSSADVWVDTQFILSIVRNVGGHAVYSVDRLQTCGWTCSLFCRSSEMYVDMQFILSIVRNVDGHTAYSGDRHQCG